MEPLARDPWSKHSGALLPEALGCLERGGIVITANARAARALSQSYAWAQRAAGKLAWQTPPIHDWESWLGILWKQHLLNAEDAPLLLSALQERAVWKRIAGAQAADSNAVATLAAQTWGLLSDFEAHAERNRSWSGSTTGDAERFREWASVFHRECHINRWISRSDLAALLTKSIQQRIIEAPTEVLLAGFDRFYPVRRALIDAVREAGGAVTMLETAEVEHTPRLVQARDLRDELATCAWWSSRLLKANPGARIAVIVQDIQGVRGEIERTFRRILAPDSVGIESNAPMPFEFSLGAPPASVPVIQAALLMLRWLCGPLEQSAISWLMLSGFLAADGEDSAEMAALDAEIRKHGKMPPEAPLEVFARYRPKRDSSTATQFLRRLRGLHRIAQAEAIGIRKTFAEWIDFANAMLKQALWPGGRALDSVEYQALDRWERLTREVAALGFDASRVPWQEFVTVLDRYAGETIFAPESHHAPIQIMRASESSGQEFDAVWFAGADDRQWPPAGRSHPLLPNWLQRKAAMPHSSMDVDWDLSLAVTRRLATSANCIFSHARQDEAGEARPSALLSEAFAGSLRAISSNKLRAELDIPEEPPPRCLTILAEDKMSVPWPRQLPAGGADILKRQSACAFQSFAVRRLGAEEIRDQERGLNALDRGNLLHHALQALWSNDNPPHLLLQDRAGLLNAKAAGVLPMILDHHIREAIERHGGAADDSEWSKEYLRIEHRRLHSLLTQWLDREAERRDFTVAELEREVDAEINGLQLQLRVDRIDRVDGGRIILDYKTGSVAPAMWEGDRPDEPQLPLYGIHGPVDDLRGVLFAQIRAGDACLNGRAEDVTVTVTDKLAGNSGMVQNPLNEDMLGAWSDALSNLADQFLAGNAAVDPKAYPKTCRYCGLQGLCRVSETLLAPKAEDDEDDQDAAFALEDGADD